MKVLVTGASGFLGRHVIPKLLERGHSVTAVARDEARARAFAWYHEVHFFARDIHAPVEDPARLFGYPEAVIHLAWQGLTNYKALSHFEESLPADYRFLRSLIQGGVGHLLVSGTCFEYGMQSGCLSEELPTAPANPYALAKDSLRKFLEALMVGRSVTLQWARLFYMHGSGQNPNSLLSQLDRAIARGDKIFDMSGGEQLRDYQSVAEVASKLVTLVEHPRCAGAVNICSGRPISVRSLVECYLAERCINIRLNRGAYPYPDYEPFAFWGSDRKYREHTDG